MSLISTHHSLSAWALSFDSCRLAYEFIVSVHWCIWIPFWEVIRNHNYVHHETLVLYRLLINFRIFICNLPFIASLWKFLLLVIHFLSSLIASRLRSVRLQSSFFTSLSSGAILIMILSHDFFSCLVASRHYRSCLSTMTFILFLSCGFNSFTQSISSFHSINCKI